MANSLRRTAFGAQGPISEVQGAHVYFQSLHLEILVSHLAHFPHVDKQGNPKLKGYCCTGSPCLVHLYNEVKIGGHSFCPSSRSFRLQKKNLTNYTKKPLFHDTPKHYKSELVQVAGELVARTSHTPPHHRDTANTIMPHSTKHKESSWKHNLNTGARGQRNHHLDTVTVKPQICAVSITAGTSRPTNKPVSNKLSTSQGFKPSPSHAKSNFQKQKWVS